MALLDAMEADLTGSFPLCRGVMGLSNVRRVRCRTADEALQLLAVVRRCPLYLHGEAAHEHACTAPQEGCL